MFDVCSASINGCVSRQVNAVETTPMFERSECEHVCRAEAVNAPVKHKVKRCDKNNCRWLSLEARAAKNVADASSGDVVELTSILRISVHFNLVYETALLELLNDVYSAGDDRRFTVVIGLDISAAFDTIVRTIFYCVRLDSLEPINKQSAR